MGEPDRKPDFIEELKRRKTVRAALVYLAAAWAGLEVAELLLPLFGLSEGSLRVLVILAAVGLPVTVVLAWLFDLTPQGLRRAAPVGGSPDGDAEVSWLSLRTGVLVLGLVGLSLGVGWWLGGSRAAPSPTVSAGVGEDVVAVIPFSVRGSAEFDYLSEGVVDLVSVKLDGAGPITTVDPRKVIARLAQEGVDTSDPEAIRRLARDLGAGRFITGNILEVGGRLTVTAYLNDTLRPDRVPAQGVREGSPDTLFELLDSMVVDLVAGAMPEEADRLRRLATVTSGSLPAVKEYLQGEQLYRLGEYRAAAEAYDRAVELDSTFALAFYRKSIAADWIDAYDVRSSAERAMELSDRLPRRERDLMAALAIRRNGDGAAAERAFAALVQQYPSDLEVLTQYGEAVFHEGPRHRQALSAALEPLQRVVELEPRNVAAQVHLARLYALYDSLDALRRLADQFAVLAPESERAMEVEAMYAFLAGDSARQEGVRRALQGREWYYRFYAVHGVSRFSRDPFGAETLLATPGPGDAYLEALVPGLFVVRGEYEAARRVMSELSRRGDPSWLLFEAFVLTTGAMPPDASRSAVLEELLATQNAVDLHRSSWMPPYEDLTVDFFAYQRDYFRVLLLLELGRSGDARTLLAEMEARPDFPHMASLKSDAEKSLRAEFALRDGDRAEALAILRTMDYQVPHASTIQPMPDLVRSRFLRAELEREMGDVEYARALYEGLDESWSPWDSYLRPLSFRALGAIAEDRGDWEGALRYYRLLLHHWRDPDPVLADRKNEIQARVTALEGPGATAPDTPAP